MSLGLRIKELRKELKLTQKDMASKLEIDHTTISKWEADVYEPDTTTLSKLADLFDVDTDYLLGRTSVRKKPETNMSFYGGSKNYTPDEIAVMEATLKAYREQVQKMKDDEKK